MEGIQNKASEKGVTVSYALGCEIGGGFMKTIGAKYFAEIEGTGKTGMRAEFFDNINLEGEPVFTRIDSMVSFRWSANPAPNVPADQFSCRWIGKIVAPETREFSIGTITDDGARLYLNGKLILEDWIEHGEKPNSAKVNLEAGKEYDIIFEHFDGSMGAGAHLTWDLGHKDFEKAKEVARDNDAVILVLGLFPGLSAEENDRTVIELPDVQQELIKEIFKVNSNIIVVLINGGPIALSDTEAIPFAIIEAWYTGQASGTAIADILFGEVNPGGKSPETFDASTEQLPPFADYDLVNNPRTYMYFEKPVLYPFWSWFVIYKI